MAVLQQERVEAIGLLSFARLYVLLCTRTGRRGLHPSRHPVRCRTRAHLRHLQIRETQEQGVPGCASRLQFRHLNRVNAVDSPTVSRGLRPDSSGGVKAISDPQNGLAGGHCHIVFNGRIYTGEVAVPCSNGRVKFSALHVSPGSRARLLRILVSGGVVGVQYAKNDLVFDFPYLC